MSRNRTLLVGLAALVLLPVLVRVLGLGVNTATQIVTLAMAALGLNLLVGFTGLTSFGHSAWFGIGAYAAALGLLHHMDHTTFYDEQPSEAVGTQLGLSAGNVRVIRHRGIDKLRRCVDAGRRLS